MIDCGPTIRTIINIIKVVLSFIQWLIPIALIIYGTLDMFKAMTKGDEKEAAKYRKTFITRLIYALVAFLIPFIVRLVFDIASDLMQKDLETKSSIDEINRGDFISCWNYKGSKVSYRHTCKAIQESGDINYYVTYSEDECRNYCSSGANIVCEYNQDGFNVSD